MKPKIQKILDAIGNLFILGVIIFIISSFDIDRGTFSFIKIDRAIFLGIVFLLALIYSMNHIHKMVQFMVTKEDTPATSMIMPCILWAIFYYLSLKY